MEKYKAHFVAHGFSQKEGIDYDICTCCQIYDHPLDHSPCGFTRMETTSNGCQDCVLARLKEALYGLKQALQAWYERIDNYLTKLGFTRSEADPNLYVKVEDDKPLRLVLYVDDLFLTGAYPLIHRCKRELASEFEMKDQGLEVWQKPREIFLSQGKDVVKILKRFGMMDCKPVTTSRILTFRSYMVVMSDQIWEMPLSFINSFALMFLVNLHPNICFAVSIVSSYLVEPHWFDAKNLLRYLRGTITNGLRYTVGDVRLLGHTDADWAGSVVDRKSTSGCYFTLGSALISWMSRKQK
eukprot:PITA_14306